MSDDDSTVSENGISRDDRVAAHEFLTELRVLRVRTVISLNQTNQN
jgi:hypothetical protein